LSYLKIIALMDPLIEKALLLLESGEPIVLPTETVYGIAVDAQNKDAVKKIYEIKNRPEFNPLISHYAEIEEIKKDVELDSRALKILEHFSPGPITLVLNKKINSRISDLASAGLKTAAVRIPNQEITLKILREFKGPVAAPSANLSTELSPTKKEHVEKSLGNKVKLIIDGDQTEHGIESTILDLSTDKAVILRFGTITSQELEKVLGGKVYLKSSDGQIKAPGMLLRHYAPKCKLRLETSEPQINEALLAFGETNIPKGFKEVINLSPKMDLAQVAKNLFSSIHTLEEKGYDSIAVMPIPNEGIGLAINDRLQRAAGKLDT
jgi:L-threonylcarbamoyladenylate synthase